MEFGANRLFQEQNKEVLRKLGFATLLMFTLPIIGFYAGLYFVFPHKGEPAAWAGGFAVFIANVVVAGYVYSAFTEEDNDENEPDALDGDQAGPRVGAFKQRTD